MTTVETPGVSASRQISDLCHLCDGWRNGEGVAFAVDYLAWLSESFSRMYPADAPVPVISPTTYGIVSIEWSFPNGEASLEIDPETRDGNLLWSSSYDHESSETILDMTNPEGWAGLTEHISK